MKILLVLLAVMLIGGCSTETYTYDVHANAYGKITSTDGALVWSTDIRSHRMIERLGLATITVEYAPNELILHNLITDKQIRASDTKMKDHYTYYELFIPWEKL